MKVPNHRLKFALVAGYPDIGKFRGVSFSMFLVALAALAQAAASSTPPVPLIAEAQNSPVEAPPVTPQSVKLPALTAIRVKVDKDLVSKTAVIGEEFDLVLAQPIDLGNGYAVPAGTRGRGWVIHASKARMGGKAGELLLGARYLKLGDIQIPLRSLKIGPPQGKDNTGLSMGLMVAVGVAGALVSGGQARVSSGMDATAKTAADVDLPVSLLEKSAPTGAVVVAGAAPDATADRAGPPAPPAPAQPDIANQTESKGE